MSLEKSAILGTALGIFSGSFFGVRDGIIEGIAGSFLFPSYLRGTVENLDKDIKDSIGKEQTAVSRYGRLSNSVYHAARLTLRTSVPVGVIAYATREVSEAYETTGNPGLAGLILLSNGIDLAYEIFRQSGKK